MRINDLNKGGKKEYVEVKMVVPNISEFPPHCKGKLVPGVNDQGERGEGRRARWG